MGRISWRRRGLGLEEAAVDELEKEFRTVSEQVEAHMAEDLRRAEEAKGPRVVEVGSDNDMEGCSSTGEGVGVDLGVGKRRKVLRSNRTPPGKLSKEELLAIFAGMPNTDRDWFKKHFIREDAVPVDTSMHDGDQGEFDSDKSDFNARATSTPIQEDVANTPCG